ncbi:MAG: NAD(P)-binding protein, partial [Verrucomicrobiota bacterium]
MTDKKQEKRKIAVIGAGLGGLASAVQLAHAGCEVSVYEKNDCLGGKINRVEEGGFSWDSG